VRLGLAGVALGWRCRRSTRGFFGADAGGGGGVGRSDGQGLAGAMASGWGAGLDGVGGLGGGVEFLWISLQGRAGGKELNPALAPYLEKMHDQRDARLLRLMAK